MKHENLTIAGYDILTHFSSCLKHICSLQNRYFL